MQIEAVRCHMVRASPAAILWILSPLLKLGSSLLTPYQMEMMSTVLWDTLAIAVTRSWRLTDYSCDCEKLLPVKCKKLLFHLSCSKHASL